MLIYNVLLIILAIIGSPILLWLGLVKGHGVKERLAIYNKELKSLKGNNTLWFHAASVGEVRILSALIPAYLSISPETNIVVSTVTKTGNQTARKLLPDSCAVIFAPLDISILVKRALKIIQPSALILTETEFWPNLIHYAHGEGVKLFCVNGRISLKSFTKYRLVKSFFSFLLNKIDFFFMQSVADSKRLVALGVDKEKVKVAGNMKFDISANENGLRPLPKPRWLQGRRTIVAGSTHRGEERIVLKAFSELLSDYPESMLFIAPRHLKRIDEVKSEVESTNLNLSLFSDCRDIDSEDILAQVIIINTIGDLKSIYGWAEIAFVGGSLDNTGGHNPLEPASWSVPALFGANMQNCREIADGLIEIGAAKYVKDSDELYTAFHSIFSDSERRKTMREQAGIFAGKHKGIAGSIAGDIHKLMRSSIGKERIEHLGSVR